MENSIMSDMPSSETEQTNRLKPREAFGFLHGHWTVQHEKLIKRLSDCTEWRRFAGTLEVQPILSGLGNFDRNILMDPEGEYEAHSLRLFSPEASTWSIYWLDSRAPGLGPAVVGSFEGAKGTFFGADEHEGRPISVRTTYEPLGSQAAEWTQAFWEARSERWETNWIMQFKRDPS